MSVACAVLAAGASLRLGRPKQLLSFCGEPLLRAITRQACDSVCAPVAVVMRPDDAGAREALDGLPVVWVDNPEASEGMASSIRAAAAWSSRAGHGALVLVACDQPALTSHHLGTLVTAHHFGAPVVASRYAGVRGIPALFARDVLPELFALRGAAGARRVLDAALGLVEVDWEAGAFDVDTEEDAALLPP